MDTAERRRAEQQARAAKAVAVAQDGQPAAVLVDAEEFALLREHKRFVVAIEEGLADVNAGRVLSTQDLKKSLESEFGPIAWR